MPIVLRDLLVAVALKGESMYQFSRHALLAFAAVVCLCGCVNSGSEPAEEEVQPLVTPDANYDSVVALKDAAVAAGFECPLWKQDDRVTYAAESGTCSRDSVLMTFNSLRDLGKQAEAYRSMASLFAKANVKKDPILVGPNWMINAAEVPTLQDTLGGELLDQ